MSDEDHDEEDFELPLDKISGLSSETVRRNVDCCSTPYSGVQYLVKRQLAVVTKLGSFDLHHPGNNSPGLFFQHNIREMPLSDEPKHFPVFGEDQEEFHDSDSRDIYTLYNVCNGEVENGLLNISKLDELSAEELEIFDVTRLKEIWIHTASGCQTCADIVETLNMVRGFFSKDEVPLDSSNH